MSATNASGATAAKGEPGFDQTTMRYGLLIIGWGVRPWLREQALLSFWSPQAAWAHWFISLINPILLLPTPLLMLPDQPVLQLIGGGCFVITIILDLASPPSRETCRLGGAGFQPQADAESQMRDTTIVAIIGPTANVIRVVFSFVVIGVSLLLAVRLALM